MKPKISTISAKEGLPNEQIHKITIDQFGRLWLAGPAGLSCYNGNNLKIIDTRNGLLCSGLRTVVASKQSTIWVGTDRGIECLSLEATRIAIELDFDWVFGVGNVFFERNEFILVGTSYGLLLLEKEGQTLRLVSKTELGFISQIISFDDSAFLVVSANEGLVVFEDGSYSKFGPDLPTVHCVYKTVENNFLVGTSEGLFFLDKDGSLEHMFFPDLDHSKVSAISLIGGNYVVAFYKSVLLLQIDSDGFKAIEVIPVGSIVNDLVGDEFNNIWIATNNAGLKKVPSFRKTIKFIETGSNEAVFSIRPNKHQNKYYIGGADFYSTIAYDRGAFSLLDKYDLDVIVWDTMVDPVDEFVVWLATQEGVYKATNGEKPVKDPDIAKVITAPCRVFLRRDDEIWVGTIAGLYYLKNGKVTEAQNAQNQNFGYVYSMGLDLQNQIWVGTLGQGLWLGQKNGFIKLLDDNLAEFGNTYSIITNSDSGKTLVTQQENIIVIDERLNSKIVFSDYPLGGWTAAWLDNTKIAVGSTDGICLIDTEKSRLENRINLYLDKTEWQFTCSKSMLKFTDSKIFCGLNGGLHLFDISKILQFALFPNLYLDSIHWQNVKPKKNNNQFFLSTGKWSMELRVYSAWMIDEGQLKYRFKLAGFDEEWSELSSTNSIRYSSLPIGEYELLAQVYTPLTGFGAAVPFFKIKVNQSLNSLLGLAFYKIGSFFDRFRSRKLKNNFLIKQNELFKKEIQERKNAETELTRYKKQLENIVRQRTEELLAQKEKAESADKMKTTFLANMSHEIRTPLAGIIGLNNLMASTGLDSVQEEYATKITHSANHLLQLINNILDITKIESGQVELEHIPFDLNKLIKEVCEFSQIKSFEPLVDLVLEQDTPPQLKLIGDSLRLKQVLFNLIGNALKFTKAGTIAIKIKQVGENDGKITLKFAISDTGIGMTEKQMQNLFGAFTQADSSIARKYGGSGLGLNISYNYVKLMGGNITVTSKPNVGTTFSFSVQFDHKETSESSAQWTISEQLANKNILIVDDNDKIKTVLSGYFAFAELKSDCIDSLKMIHYHPNKTYDIVLVDWDENNCHSLEELEEFKSKHCSSHTKIVLIGSKDKDFLMLKSASTLVNAILLKPITPHKLFSSCEQLFADLPSQTKQISDGQRTANEKKPTQQDKVPNNEALKILAAEDNGINQLVLKKMLLKKGIEITMTSNGKECVEELSKNPDYDLILMDKQMPEMDGLEATNYIRTVLNNKNIVIIVLTADVTVETQTEFRKYGFDDYLPKPFKPQDLYEKLDYWSSQRTSSV